MRFLPTGAYRCLYLYKLLYQAITRQDERPVSRITLAKPVFRLVMAAGSFTALRTESSPTDKCHRTRLLEEVMIL